MCVIRNTSGFRYFVDTFCFININEKLVRILSLNQTISDTGAQTGRPNTPIFELHFDLNYAPVIDKD